MMQLAAWYQKKISSYDKEEWETMVEQLLMRGTYRRRIVDFSSHARSYLIDVDLVRGSSFPKAKPTLGMRRVVWFALVRLVFLPALYQWWAQQTSPTCAKFLLGLWLMQVINLTLYIISPASIGIDPNCWIVPLCLMVILSIVHSQIVSTTEMELARVRPRSTFRRKLPRYFRRPRSECDGGSGDGGGSAESGATSSQSKAPSTKPSKFRRRLSRTDMTDTGLRKRKKDLTKDISINKLETPTKTKPLSKLKIKDSDDEDYMAWKKPDVTAPIVTFTPPPDEAIAGCSFDFQPNILTKKHLETFNVRQSQSNAARTVFPEGDDGFESLNGYNSNGSDGDRLKEAEQIVNNNKDNEQVIEKNDTNIVDKCKDISNPKVEEDDEKSVDPDSDPDGANPTSSPSDGKRVGVRFRSSWVKDNARHVSSDDDLTTKKKSKKLENYQSSSSDGECSASAPSIALPSHHTMSDWVGQTTNSEESSYCSQSEAGHSGAGFHCTADSSCDPFYILDPTSDTVKCTMWECGSTLRAELSAVDISWYVVARAERAMAADGCLWAGLVMAATVALFSPALRLVQIATDKDKRTEEELQSLSLLTYIMSAVIKYSQGSVVTLLSGAFGSNKWVVTTNLLACVLRFALSGLVFFLLAVAERAFKQRFLYAKLFSHLTSARRARKSELPHFRLNTVRNIKTWLSTRSYLRRRGPQRSVDVIVSDAFMLTLILLAYVSSQLLRVIEPTTNISTQELSDHVRGVIEHSNLLDAATIDKVLSEFESSISISSQSGLRPPATASQQNSTENEIEDDKATTDSVTLDHTWFLEAMVWSCCLGIYLLRLLTLGSNVNRKYRGCLSAILTEQINLHLAIEQRPESKEQLTVANNVLKLAADLLKELDSPFKMSAICANQYLYTVTKVVVLSALSGVLSDILGFKLKLHKIKIK